MPRYSDQLIDQYINLEDFLDVLKTYLSYNEATKKHLNLDELRETAKKFIESNGPVGFWGEKSKYIEYAVNAHVLAKHLESQETPVGFGYLDELISALANLDQETDISGRFSIEKVTQVWSDVRHFRGSLQHRTKTVE